jgi:WD40 repeat protein
MATLPAHTDGVCALAISTLLPDSLASVGHDGSLRVWDLVSEVSVQELSLHRQNRDSGALGVAVHAKERLLVTAGADAAIRVLTWSGGPAMGSSK